MPQPMAMGWRGYLVGARRFQFLDPVLHNDEAQTIARTVPHAAPHAAGRLRPCVGSGHAASSEGRQRPIPS
jgi:hypothetical protein